MLGMAILQTLNGPQPSADSKPPVSGGPCESAAENLHSEQRCEDPSLPPLPRPRAATVVPKQNLLESCDLKVAVTVPLARPHPPPSVHVITPPASPPLPAPKPETDSVKPSLDVPDQTDSCQTTQFSATPSLALCLDTVSNVGTLSEVEGSLTSPGTPMAVSPLGAPVVLGLPSNSDPESSGNGAEPAQRTASPENPASSSLSTDSIDFFTAREKFLGLSQDGPTQQLSEAAALRTVHSRCSSLCLEDPSTAPVEEVRKQSHSALPLIFELLRLRVF